MKRKRPFSIFIITILSILLIVPVSGNQEDISKWAKSDIVEFTRYGTYDKENYKENYKENLTKISFDRLLKDLENKLESTNLEKNQNFVKISIGNELSRGNFLKGLYNKVGIYDFGIELIEPMEYLQNANILMGDGENLLLDKNITLEEGVVFVKRAVDYIYNKNDIATKGLMWVIENKNNKAYFLGSIHTGDSSLYPLSKEIVDRYNESQELYVEVDITDTKTMEDGIKEIVEKEMKDYFYTDGTSLKSVIGDKRYEKVKTILDYYGIMEIMYKDMKPYGIISEIENLFALEVKAEYENIRKDSFDYGADGGFYGIDIYFLDKANAENKDIYSLEDISMQLEILYQSPYKDLPIDEQVLALDNLLEYIEDPENNNMPDSLAQALSLVIISEYDIKLSMEIIKNGDENKLKEMMKIDETEDIYGGNLFGERDAKMAKKIAELLESDEGKVYFIIVGVGHLSLEGTTLDNLRAMGYDVKSLN